jgi:hypothetical protein
MTDKIIYEDGSIEGGFSENKNISYPRPQPGETYRNYRARVSALVAQGFHLGDLGWSDYITYCKGSGSYDGVDADTKIS